MGPYQIDYNKCPNNLGRFFQLYIEHGVKPSSFLTAVLENNLMEAIGRGDYDNINRLSQICTFVYNELPVHCWGSVDNVSDWMYAVRKAERVEPEEPLEAG